MKRRKNILIALALQLLVGPLGLQGAYAQRVSELKFYDVRQLVTEGKAVILGQAEKAADSCGYYYRLPLKLKGAVREEL